LVCSKLPKRYETQRIRGGAGGEGKGQCRALFDVDSLEKPVTLAPLLGLELLPSPPTRFRAFGTAQQEHLHSHIRLLARNDQRECSVAREMIRSLAEHMFLGRPRRSSHAVPPIGPRGSRPAALCLRRTIVSPARRLPLFIALVRVVTGCVQVAAWRPPGDPHHGFLFGHMSRHMLTKWLPLASRNGTVSFDAECSDFRYFWRVECSAVTGAQACRADPGGDQADDD
jgi:hypothetical protein